MERERENYAKIKGSEQVSSPIVKVDGVEEPVCSNEILSWTDKGEQKRIEILNKYLEEEKERLKGKYDEEMKLRKIFSFGSFGFL